MIQKYNSGKKAPWDSFVASAKNATFLFYRDFIDYHQNQFEDYSLMIYKDEKLIALLPANVSKNKIYSHQGLTYGGLIVSDSIKIRDFTSCLKAVLDYFKNEDFTHVQWKQLPTIYSHVPNDELQYLMYILDANLLRRDTLSVINLKHKPKFSKDRIAGNKRAIKHGLLIKEELSFDAFWNDILIPNLNKKHETQPVHSLDEINKLKIKFPKNVRQFNVYKNNIIVAGTTIFETKNVAHSQYISGNDDKNIIGSLDFLHVHLIDEVFKDKSYFDFGISNENSGKNINEGLNYWKEGFGARTIAQDFYEIDVNNLNKLDTIFI